ncbi:MAG: hypothetical protein H0U70_10015 [Tatlockia sp.]|nr:hypothetical protein [Tatlockia sp.]
MRSKYVPKKTEFDLVREEMNAYGEFKTNAIIQTRINEILTLINPENIFKLSATLYTVNLIKVQLYKEILVEMINNLDGLAADFNSLKVQSNLITELNNNLTTINNLINSNLPPDFSKVMVDLSVTYRQVSFAKILKQAKGSYTAFIDKVDDLFQNKKENFDLTYISSLKDKEINQLLESLDRLEERKNSIKKSITDLVSIEGEEQLNALNTASMDLEPLTRTVQIKLKKLIDRLAQFPPSPHPEVIQYLSTSKQDDGYSYLEFQQNHILSTNVDEASSELKQIKYSLDDIHYEITNSHPTLRDNQQIFKKFKTIEDSKAKVNATTLSSIKKIRIELYLLILTEMIRHLGGKIELADRVTLIADAANKLWAPKPINEMSKKELIAKLNEVSRKVKSGDIDGEITAGLMKKIIIAYGQFAKTQAAISGPTQEALQKVKTVKSNLGRKTRIEINIPNQITKTSPQVLTPKPNSIEDINLAYDLIIKKIEATTTSYPNFKANHFIIVTEAMSALKNESKNILLEYEATQAKYIQSKDLFQMESALEELGKIYKSLSTNKEQLVTSLLQAQKSREKAVNTAQAIIEIKITSLKNYKMILTGQSAYANPETLATLVKQMSSLEKLKSELAILQLNEIAEQSKLEIDNSNILLDKLREDIADRDLLGLNAQEEINNKFKEITQKLSSIPTNLAYTSLIDSKAWLKRVNKRKLDLEIMLSTLPKEMIVIEKQRAIQSLSIDFIEPLLVDIKNITNSLFNKISALHQRIKTLKELKATTALYHIAHFKVDLSLEETVKKFNKFGPQSEDPTTLYVCNHNDLAKLDNEIKQLEICAENYLKKQNERLRSDDIKTINNLLNSINLSIEKRSKELEKDFESDPIYLILFAFEKIITNRKNKYLNLENLYETRLEFIQDIATIMTETFQEPTLTLLTNSTSWILRDLINGIDAFIEWVKSQIVSTQEKPPRYKVQFWPIAYEVDVAKALEKTHNDLDRIQSKLYESSSAQLQENFKIK